MIYNLDYIIPLTALAAENTLLLFLAYITSAPRFYTLLMNYSMNSSSNLIAY